MASLHAGHRARLRERAAREGIAAFSPHEVIELLLFYPIPVRNVNPLAHALIDALGSVGGVLTADPAQTGAISGAGGKTAAFLAGIGEAVERYQSREIAERPQLGSPRKVLEHCRRMRLSTSEPALSIISLDKSCRLMGLHTMENPIAGRALLRDIAATALRDRAQQVILVASGPSERPIEDLPDFLRDCHRCLSRMRISLCDCIAVSPQGSRSLLEAGEMRLF